MNAIVEKHMALTEMRLVKEDNVISRVSTIRMKFAKTNEYIFSIKLHFIFISFCQELMQYPNPRDLKNQRTQHYQQYQCQSSHLV